MNATPVQNAIKVVSTESLPDGVKVITVHCEDGAEFKSLPAALNFEGRVYGKTGWNSDRYIAYYRDDAKIARAI